MAEIALKDLADTFKKAIIINFENKTIEVIKEGQIKVYSKHFFNDLVTSLSLMDFESDER